MHASILETIDETIGDILSMYTYTMMTSNFRRVQISLDRAACGIHIQASFIPEAKWSHHKYSMVDGGVSISNGEPCENWAVMHKQL